MKVLLDLNGWRKIINIDSYTVNKGVIEIRIDPPMNVMINPRGKPIEMIGTSAAFYHTGSREAGLLVFAYN